MYKTLIDVSTADFNLVTVYCKTGYLRRGLSTWFSTSNIMHGGKYTVTEYVIYYVKYLYLYTGGKFTHLLHDRVISINSPLA